MRPHPTTGPLVAFAVLVAVVGSGMLAFGALRAVEWQMELPGYDYSVVVQSPDMTLTDEQYTQQVARIAQDHHVLVEVTAPAAVDAFDEVFHVTGPGSQDLLDQGTYDSFAGGASGRFAPMALLPSEYRSAGYLVKENASSAERGQVTAALGTLGGDVRYVDAGFVTVLLSVCATAPLSTLLGSTLLMSTVLGAAGAVTTFRARAVLDLHGRSGAGAVARAAVAVCVHALTAQALLTVPVVVLLGVLNRSAHLGMFVGLWCATSALMALAVLCGHTVGSSLARRTPLTLRLGGAVRSRTLHLSVFAVHLVALMTLVPAWGTVALTTEVLASRVSNDARWAGAADLAALNLRDDSTTRHEADVLRRTLGSWIVDREKAGTAMLVREGVVADLVPQASPGTGARALLTVDSTYLRRTPLSGTGTAVVAAPAADEVLVLMPEDLDVPTSQLVDGVRTSLDLARTAAAKYGGDDRAARTVFTVTTAEIPADAQAFVYTDPAASTTSSVVDGPVVVVWPSSTPVQSYDTWVAWMSQGAVLFGDRDGLVAELRAHDLLRYVAGVQSVTGLRTVSMRDAAEDARTAGFALVAALLTTTVSAASAGLVHVRRRHRRVFAQYVHGWSFGRRHGALIAAHGALAAAVVFGTGHRAEARRVQEALFLGYTTTPEVTLLSMLALTVGSVVVLAAGLLVASRQVVHGRSRP